MQIIIPEVNKHLSIVADNMAASEKERDKVDENSFNLFKKSKNESIFQYDDIHLMLTK